MIMNVLVVDDVEANIYSLESLIKELNVDETKIKKINILKSLSGEEALKIAISHPVDLIILDVQMPNMNGFEVAKFLQSNHKTRHIPIVFLTAAFKSEEFIQHGFELGAIDYFTKPIEKFQFINKIRLHLIMAIKNKELQESENKLKLLNVNLKQEVENGIKEQKEQYSYLRSIIDGVEDPIMVIREDYTVKLMNSTLKDLSRNMKLLDYENPKCFEISHSRITPCDSSNHQCPLIEVIETKMHTTVIHEHTDSKGGKRKVELSANPLFDEENNCIGIIEYARDITAHIEAQEKLREQKIILHHQAHHDALTGLANRVLFNDRLEHAILNAKRDSHRAAIFFIDLDHFKEINDSLGHGIGDEVLKVVTARLNATIRENDTLARQGGDEFTILLEGLQQPQDASSLAKKILKVLAEPIKIENNILYVSSSIGISVYPDDGQSPQNLLKYADSAMYKAKREGRNNFQYYSSEMTELAFERVIMESNLRTALINEEFIVFYQPQINGNSNLIIGMEALVRWKHPTLGLISPAKFIPLAELTGLIVDIDRLVMKNAMMQIVEWYKEGLNPGVMAMNLSVKQLQQKDFVTMLEVLMKETGCKSQWIELEVTESQIMTNPEEAIKVLKAISDIGIELAIDDFGTGYSSLAYLKKLPIDKLKIDQSFVRDLPCDREDAAIAKAVIAFGKGLNLKIIAEGVETKEQKEFIVENGCQNIQGYFYYKPMPADEMKDILQKV